MNRSIAPPSAAGSRSGTSSPFTPGSTISGMPASGVEITGNPAAIASMITVGKLSIPPSASRVHGRTNIVACASRAAIWALRLRAGQFDAFFQSRPR